MPITKYRRVEDMPQSIFFEGSAEEAIAAACSMSQMCLALNPLKFPSGVHKYRSIEDAAKQRERWFSAQRTVTR